MWFYSILVVVLLTGQKCSGNATNCLEKEKSLGVLDFARQSIEKAEDLFPDCFENDNSTSTSVCGKKEKALAFLQIAKDMIAEAEKNYPTCLDVVTTVRPDVTTTVLPDVTTDVLPNATATVFPDLTTTVLPDVTTTVLPDVFPMDCIDVLVLGYNTSGVYKVWPRSPLMKNQSISVYCDMETDGGGWTVVQRRGGFPVLQNFNQSWANYKKGFGDLKSEFWLGNDYIYMISNQAEYEVRFDLTDFDGIKKYAVYHSFHIDSEAEKYELHATDYSGNARDGFWYENGYPFSTFDRNNQRFVVSPPCAIQRAAGWWYNGCNKVNINGIPDKNARKNVETNLYWYEWKKYESLATADMKLRRRG